jgi:nucleotide-binding universal stress UspA family protein
MYSNILAPTDGSDRAEAAIEEAADLAAVCDARVHGLFVTDSGPEEAVERVAAAGADRGVETTTAVMSGTVHRAIADYVDDNDIDAVVMATHSREGVSRHFLGSVTERVIRTVDVPVVAVTGPDET